MRSQKAVLEGNIQALEAVFQWHEGKVLSEEQAQQLQSFTGWGFTKAVLYSPYVDSEWESASEADRKLRPVVQELHDLLKDKLAEKSYKQVVDSIKASVLTSFYTPAIIPSTFYKVLREYTDVRSLYEPSAGSGVFITTAVQELPNLVDVKAYEKDMLTGKVLSAIVEGLPIASKKVHICGFEESGGDENYDIICSNVPFGSFPIFDPTIKDRNLTGRIHSYFVAKGLTKLKDKGVMAILVTSAFLDSPTGKTARRYLYSNADHISVICMPDNLYKESANTEAPSHFIVVRKRVGKTEADMSEEELLLCESSMQDIDGIKVAINQWIYSNSLSGVRIGECKVGKNQYGKPALETWWGRDIADVSEPFSEILRMDFDKRYVRDEADALYMFSQMSVDDQCSFPIGKLEVVNPSTFKWTEDVKEVTDTPFGKEHIIVASIPKYEADALEKELANRDVADEIPPWEEQWELEKHTGIILQPIAEVIEVPKKIVIQKEQIVGATTHLVPGSIVKVKVGQKDMYTDQIELLQIETISDKEITGVKPDVKSGRETDILESYIEVRDLYMDLQEAEKQNQ